MCVNQSPRQCVWQGVPIRPLTINFSTFKQMGMGGKKSGKFHYVTYDRPLTQSKLTKLFSNFLGKFKLVNNKDKTVIRKIKVRSAEIQETESAKLSCITMDNDQICTSHFGQRFKKRNVKFFQIFFSFKQFTQAYNLAPSYCNSGGWCPPPPLQH